MTEAELAAKVVAWLEGGFDVYQEVEGVAGVADIVAVEIVRPKRCWIIETKRTLSLEVLGQAERWKRFEAAHMVSVAVPSARRHSKGRHFAEIAAGRFGIGVLVVGTHEVKERHRKPELTRRLHPNYDIRKWLREEHKHYAKAGSAGGGHYTVFKGTCEAARGFVERNPGCTMRELVAGIDHHYASAKGAVSTLAARIRDGVAKGLLVEEGRPLRVWIDTAAKRKELGVEQD